jgi:hypothetical protein
MEKLKEAEKSKTLRESISESTVASLRQLLQRHFSRGEVDNRKRIAFYGDARERLMKDGCNDAVLSIGVGGEGENVSATLHGDIVGDTLEVGIEAGSRDTYAPESQTKRRPETSIVHEAV